MSSESYHEPYELLSEGTKNMHRALVSVMEELEAIDWYQQRAEACSDAELKEILLHNKQEEIEHALMTLEWIRRALPQVDEMLERHIGHDGPIVPAEKDEEEEQSDGGDEPASAVGERSLGLGSLRSLPAVQELA